MLRSLLGSVVEIYGFWLLSLIQTFPPGSVHPSSLELESVLEAERGSEPGLYSGLIQSDSSLGGVDSEPVLEL